MDNDEEIDRLQVLVWRMLVMLRKLEKGYPWYDVGGEMKDVEREAKALGIEP